MNCEKCDHEMRPPKLPKNDHDWDFVPFWECPNCHKIVMVPSNSELRVARTNFHQALKKLQRLAGDFSEDGQRQWVVHLHHTNELRNTLCFLEQRREELHNETIK